MTDREIKKLLKKAYYMPETESAKRFIKEHEKRSCQLWDIVRTEFRYMGVKSIFVCILLCALFLVVNAKGDTNIMWIVSSMVPVCSMVPMLFIFRAEKYGMCELETASRFSLKFIRLIRMLILVIFSVGVILGGSLIFRDLWMNRILDIVVYMLFPYLVSIWGCLFVARNWHGKESSIGVPLICIMTGFLPSIIRELRKIQVASDYIYVFFTIVMLVAIINECKKYVKERAELLWN